MANEFIGIEKLSGVYVITNTIDNKVYIGSAKSVGSRFRVHKSLLRNNKHYNTHLQNAWNKYGENAFTFKILEQVIDNSSLTQVEQKYIDEYNACESNYGYNFKKKAESNLGIKFGKQTQEHINKRMDAKKGYKHSDETKQKMSESAKNRGVVGGWTKGKKKSPEFVEAMRISRKGIPWSEARRNAQVNKTKIVKEN